MVSFQKKTDDTTAFKMGLQDSTKDFVILMQDQTLFSIDHKTGDVVFPRNLRVNDALKIGLNGSLSVNGVT